MYVTLTCRIADDVIEEKEVKVLDKYDLIFEIKNFAYSLNVDDDKIQYTLEPEEFIDLFGITFFGDRDE